MIYSKVVEVDNDGYNLRRCGYFIYDEGGNFFDFAFDTLFLKSTKREWKEHLLLKMNTKSYDNLEKLATGKAYEGIQ